MPHPRHTTADHNERGIVEIDDCGQRLADQRAGLPNYVDGNLIPMRGRTPDVHRHQPPLPLQQLGTVDQMVQQFGGLGMVNIVLAAFALLGLFLAALGLYAVIVRLVAQRTPEIGLRIALGAQPRDVVWLILRSGLKLTLLGTVIGLLGAAGLVRFIASLATELPVQDPIAIAAVTVLLFGVALLACWLPARRATKVDPNTALRAE